MNDPTKPTITIDRRSYETHYVVPNDLIPHFKQMVSRALNVWCDAHPALKEFGDILETGAPRQTNYYAQRTDKPIR